MRTLCDVCESAAAILFCAADEAALCRSCDDKVSKFDFNDFVCVLCALANVLFSNYLQFLVKLIIGE